MAIRSVFAFSVLFLFTYCDAKADNCSEARCKLLPLSKGFASEFRSKAVEKGVRMIYLQLKIGHDSYNPLQASNEFLPYRWVWAPTIGELFAIFVIRLRYSISGPSETSSERHGCEVRR